MNVVYISLEALILKATHEALTEPDAGSIEAFCSIMRDATDGAQLAARALSARIHSRNSKEALLTLIMVDKCMRRCDSIFHGEIGKFRFLNEMIKLVSPKYLADSTAPEVRSKVLQLLYTWSLEYPKESKFKVAYEMLKNQGVVKETPPPLPADELPPPAPRLRNPIFEDEEKAKLLQKLLQSKKPEDLNHANKLIRNMVKEEERRTSRLSEVSHMMSWVSLLDELLENANSSNPEELELLNEVHANCVSLHSNMQSLASAIPDHDPSIGAIVQANSDLVSTLEKYNNFMLQRSLMSKASTKNNESLLDFAEGGINKKNEEESLVSKSVVTSTLDELGEIFANSSAATKVEPLQPINIATDSLEATALDCQADSSRAWGELDSLGDLLMKQSLPDNVKRVESFSSKTLKKIPMNSLEKPTTLLSEKPLNNTILDLDFFTNSSKQTFTPLGQSDANSNSDDVMVDITIDANKVSTTKSDLFSNIMEIKPLLKTESMMEKTCETVTYEPKISDIETDKNKEIPLQTTSAESAKFETQSKTLTKAKHTEIKPLTDIVVTLDSVKPSAVPSLTAFEDDMGLSVVLHFAKNKPRDDTNVIVISTTSRSHQSIESYKFQPVLPKTCKWRLLTASGMTLLAYNPFLPPPAITQLLLIARPPNCSVDLKFAITYSSDGEELSEIGEVKELPLDLV